MLVVVQNATSSFVAGMMTRYKMIDDSKYWRIVGMRAAGATTQQIADAEDLCTRAVFYNLRLGQPTSRKRKPRKQRKALQKRRILVRRLLTKRIVVHEQVVPTLNKNGRQRKNSKQARVEYRHPFGSLARCRRELATQHDIVVSRSTIARDRKAAGLVCRKRGKGPERHKGDEQRRMQWAKGKLPFARRSKHLVAFVDEKMFDSLDCDQYAYVKPGEVPPPRERTRFPPRVHVFGMISVGVRFIHVFGDDESVNAQTYREKCLKPMLRLLAGKYLLHDNAGPHSGSEAWLKKRRDNCLLGLVDMPPRSPDANPIEKMWAIVQRDVSASGPLTAKKLREFVVEKWNGVSQAVVDKLCRAWDRQLGAIVKSKGATVCGIPAR